MYSNFRTCQMNYLLRVRGTVRGTGEIFSCVRRIRVVGNFFSVCKQPRVKFVTLIAIFVSDT